MNSTTNFATLLKRISSILLILAVIIQIAVVLLLAADFDELGIDEFHEISGYILLGLMLIHTALYWKSLKLLFSFRRKG